MNAIPQFDSFFRQVTNALPKSVFNLHQDLEKNLRVAVDSALRKMNLVTREEFEVQSAVLERTRSRLEQLEKIVAALELKATDDKSSSNQQAE